MYDVSSNKAGLPCVTSAQQTLTQAGDLGAGFLKYIRVRLAARFPKMGTGRFLLFTTK